MPEQPQINNPAAPEGLPSFLGYRPDPLLIEMRTGLQQVLRGLEAKGANANLGRFTPILNELLVPYLKQQSHVADAAHADLVNYVQMIARFQLGEADEAAVITGLLPDDCDALKDAIHAGFSQLQELLDRADTDDDFEEPSWTELLPVLRKAAASAAQLADAIDDLELDEEAAAIAEADEYEAEAPLIAEDDGYEPPRPLV